MSKLYLIVSIIFIYLIGFIVAQRQTNVVTCPNYSYKCPDCEGEQFCSYPSSYGCKGSGVPVCQSKCHGIICSTKALPCPDECPFSCEYHGPACCPFIGQPTCLPPCETFVPCKITPCPSECTADCFYPNADYCCPHSGQPVCRSQHKDIASSQQNKLLKRTEILSSKSTPGDADNGSDGSSSPALPDAALDDIDNEKKNPICIDMIVPCPQDCPNDCEYPTDVPCPLTHTPKCRTTINAVQTGYTNNKKNDITTAELNNLANELTDIVGEEVNVISQLKELLSHEHSLLEWIIQQRSSLTSDQHSAPPQKSSTTPSSTTTIRLPSSKMCPMIYVPCPELCPTTCIRRPDAPCPLAVPGYCP